MRGAGLRLLVGAGALLCAGAVGAAAQEPLGSADVDVTLEGAGAARVAARYVITPTPSLLAFRAMARRCTEVLDPRVERGGREVPLTTVREGPWLVLRDTSGATWGDTLRATVRYRVRAAGTLDRVPLPVLETPVPQADGEREGTVRVQVRFRGTRGRVVFPHMAREDTSSWSARYVAVPSFVAVAIPDRAASPCPPTGPAGPDGGLVWRFWLLVGIMAAWVPLYLVWARSTGEDGA